MTAKLQGFGTTIFAEMTALAIEHDAVNLGQGFPDQDGPDVIKRAAIAAIEDGYNQYAPGTGVPALRRAIAEHQQRFHGLAFDADAEITVTAGATEAIFATLQALLDVGDEVLTFEPFYDSYRASVAMAGAQLEVVTLRPPQDGGTRWTYDPAELEAKVSPRTRVLLLNSPHNPTGKVFSREELEHLAELCVTHDLVAVTDEVYEHLVFDGEHVPLASLPGMRERTVTISSAGKTFSFTGWKIGWTCAPPALTRAVRTAKQFVTFTNGTPFQWAVADGLQLEDDYFQGFVDDYRRRRDRLCDGLADAGFEVFVPEGTYFATVDIRSVGGTDDVTFCRQLPARAGVAAVPTSGFYLHPERGRHLVRFAFCKTDAVIDEGIERLRRG
ncbi:MAG: pyridoxal phosphate-dependent aminotransferase [Actinobacteria bacterium]|nr:pyridoxal phosphate-dependent aminotransferase [Actinomycetota bacterium]